MVWVKVEDKVLCDWVYEQTEFLKPRLENSSLHCWEEQFELHGTMYKLSGTFSSDEFGVEKWK